MTQAHASHRRACTHDGSSEDVKEAARRDCAFAARFCRPGLLWLRAARLPGFRPRLRSRALATGLPPITSRPSAALARRPHAGATGSDRLIGHLLQGPRLSLPLGLVRPVTNHEVECAQSQGNHNDDSSENRTHPLLHQNSLRSASSTCCDPTRPTPARHYTLRRPKSASAPSNSKRHLAQVLMPPIGCPSPNTTVRPAPELIPLCSGGQPCSSPCPGWAATALPVKTLAESISRTAESSSSIAHGFVR